MKRSISLLSLLAVGCVTSFVSKEPLTFEQVAYESPDGRAWTEDRVPLPKIGERFGLVDPPKVAYVELNPDGARTILFIHGLGSNLKFWRYQLDVFARNDYRVLALDMLGYGKSDKPASFPYTMEAMAEVVRAFAAAVDADRPIIVGHSMGGHVALAFAITYPDELSALVLTAPAGFEKFSRREKAWFRKVFSSALVMGADEERIWENIRGNNFENWRPEYEWLVEERVRVVRSPDFDQYAYANVKSVQGLTETDFVRDNLARIRVPTLIIFGDRDRLIPNRFMHGGATSAVMKFGHERIEGSKLVRLNRCGHMIQIDCAERYNEDVRAFLDSMKGRSRAIARDE